MTSAREPASRAKAHQSYHLADGTKVPSVTTILKVIAKGEYLLTWANNLGLEGYDVVEYRKAQAAVGTLGHAMIQADLRGEVMNLYGFSQEEIDRAENVLASFRRWRREMNPTPILVEEPLVSESARYGGTIDLYASVGGQPGIVDVKSANDIYDEHFFQVAAYRRLLVENGYPVEFNAILQCGREEGDGYRFEMAKRPADDLAIFDRAHKLYDSIQARERALKNLAPMRKSNKSIRSATLVLGGGGAEGKEAPAVPPPAIAGGMGDGPDPTRYDPIGRPLEEGRT